MGRSRPVIRRLNFNVASQVLSATLANAFDRGQSRFAVVSTWVVARPAFCCVW